MIAAYAAAYAWRHYAKSSVQRGILSVLGWPRWIYKRVKHGVLLGVYGVLVAVAPLGHHAARREDLRALTGRPGGPRADRPPARPVASRSDATGTPTREDSLHRAALHLLPELRDRDRRARAARAPAAPRRRARRGSWRPRDGGAAGARASAACRSAGCPGREDAWAAFATKLRMTIDYLRYLDPAYAGAPRLRARARERVPRIGLWLVAAAGAHTTLGRPITRTVLQAYERAMPRSAAIDAFLREQQPDVVLFTPLIGVVASPQLDYLQSARALGLSDGAVRVELGSPVEQGDSAHRSRPRVRLERHAARRGGHAARRPAGSRRRHRRAVLRSVVRPAAVAGPRRVLPQGRAAAGSSVPAVRLLGALPGQRDRGAVRAAMGPRVARKRARAARVHADPRAPASVADEGMGGRRPRRPRATSCCGGGIRSMPTRAPTTSIRCLTAPRSSASTPARSSRARSPAGRCIATLLPEHHENQEGTIHFHYLLNVERRFAAHGADAERSCAAAQCRAPGGGQRVRAQPPVRRGVHPASRGGRAGVSGVAGEVEQLAAIRPAAARDADRGAGCCASALRPAAALAALEAAAPLMLSAHEREITARASRPSRARRRGVAREGRAEPGRAAAQAGARRRSVSATRRSGRPNGAARRR